VKTISRRHFISALPFLGDGLSATVRAQHAPAPATLFQNARIFDGKSGALSGRSDLVVKVAEESNAYMHDPAKTDVPCSLGARRFLTRPNHDFAAAPKALSG
jgi:hypothetical protein